MDEDDLLLDLYHKILIIKIDKVIAIDYDKKYSDFEDYSTIKEELCCYVSFLKQNLIMLIRLIIFIPVCSYQICSDNAIIKEFLYIFILLFITLRLYHSRINVRILTYLKIHVRYRSSKKKHEIDA